MSDGNALVQLMAALAQQGISLEQFQQFTPEVQQQFMQFVNLPRPPPQTVSMATPATTPSPTNSWTIPVPDEVDDEHM